MAPEQPLLPRASRPLQKMARSPITTVLLLAFSLAIFISTNRMYTMLDDEANAIGIASLPVASQLENLRTGRITQHPPLGDLLLHGWMVATHDSFAMLRVPANLFLVLSIWFIAKSAEKLAGRRAYWITLGLGLAWPFAFQYGRIAGYYLIGMALISLLTWIYLLIVENSRLNLLWYAFTAVAVLALWTNYFVFAIFVLLLFDLVWFHRQLTREKMRSLLGVAFVIALASVPLLIIIGANHDSTPWRSLIAAMGYPVFSIFGSAAIAPWYWALSVPVALCALVLCVCVCFSRGRKWMIYFSLLLAAQWFSGQMNEKRTLFVMSWFFLAIGLAASGSNARVSRLAQGAAIGLLLFGWAGIVSGRHYATTNLLEPWPQVASDVAGDLKRGRPTLIGDSVVFFLYLDYQLAPSANSGPIIYRGAAAYTSLGPGVYWDTDAPPAIGVHGDVILVNGSAPPFDIAAMDQIDTDYQQRCTLLKDYKAAPDPAFEWKRRFATSVAALPYRVDVRWFNCP